MFHRQDSLYKVGEGAGGEHPGRHPGSFSKLLPSHWNKNLRSGGRAGVKLVRRHSKKCFRFSPSHLSPPSILWELLFNCFDESTTLAPNNPSCYFSKSSSGANILISYNLPNICVNSLAYEANFSAIFFSWHSTIEISNNHIFYYSFICP